MSGYQTPDQVREECLKTMGDELGSLYYDLHQGLSWLHLKWQQYRGLFGTDEARVTLLNQTAPTFFGVVQRTLFDDIVLHLARMTDPPVSMRTKENVTVHRFPELVKDLTFRAEVEAFLQRIDDRCGFARNIRNRRLAHTDLPTLRHTHAEPLPSDSRRDVDMALAEITGLLQRFSQEYQDADMAYGFIQEQGGADSLVYHLKHALQEGN